MNIKSQLQQLCGDTEFLRLNDINIEPETIRAIMINEVVPFDSDDDFYGKPDSAYMSTTIPLFLKAGIKVNSIQDILNLGIYITHAVKTPKSEYAVSKDSIEESLPYLEHELKLFPNLQVVMLMGDVAKKAFNMISKKASGKNAVPSISTYKLRNTEIFYKGWRILPSYIMTGQNLLIEKSKFQMASEDITLMYRLISDNEK
ncbi:MULTISPECIES: uracil-DNA glycosylase family protein [Bacteroidales]|uniref:Uracil-DNA glycosylase n=2 Tax=Muribaculum intestinale TaxID=1796646 RepID=A0A1B1S9R1_9BACT|nr:MULTISPECIES: uracil-DNA glycosylase family protein [Bacteroidales]ANU63538.1 uracil-DNA glycosylase [Muribaculum intestinale]ASB38383.1 uracil-DNA glycosylase [Muribaculum intestinale]PWB02411.1 uracil-DNA glycosylase [Muribaculum intestinale]PWB09992.1 uracil-DNA glycosylase [Muribaculum intestinale]QQR09128.1 uracil-DNA glycosylase [Muribaculum intestinale]